MRLPNFRLAIGLALVLIAAFAVACDSEPAPEDGDEKKSDADIFAEFGLPPEFAADPDQEFAVETEETLKLELAQLNPRTREVGDIFWIGAHVTVDQEFWGVDTERIISGSLDLSAEFDTVENFTQADVRDGDPRINASFLAICASAGTGTYTVKAVAQINDANGAGVGDEIVVTADGIVDCVEKNLTNLNNISRFDELTSDALGFSDETLNWVKFEQDDIILRLSQIAPINVEVGDSVEVYADFDARGRVLSNAGGLSDAFMEFTGGGPIRIDSPPSRQMFDSEGDRTAPGLEIPVLWGFRSATITCTEEGEGVYSMNLTGPQFRGTDISQTVSGLINCEAVPTAPPAIQFPEFVAVYTIDGRPYPRVQFRVDAGDDHCILTHAHSDVTVHAISEWTYRGGGDTQITGDAPLTDPDPDACGFGNPVNLLNPGQVEVTVQAFVEFCDTALPEIERIAPTSEAQTLEISNFIDRCETRRQLLQ